MRRIFAFLIVILLGFVSVAKVYQLDDLLKRYRAMMKYRKLISEQKIVTGFDADSSVGLIPLDEIEGSVGMKVEFLDSLELFLDMESVNELDFGLSWKIIKRGSNLKEKEFLRRVVEGEIEVVNIYFNYLEMKNKLARLKESLEKSEVAWETTMPVDYGLLKIELQNMKDRLKTMCGIPEKEEIDLEIPKVEIFDLVINLDEVLKAIYVLYSPPNFDPDLNVKAFLSKENGDMRFNLGFDISWSENLDFESSNWKYFAELEMDKVKKLYSQMEFLKKVLKDYVEKDDKNSQEIFNHYSLEVMRLYNQLKVMEDIVR